MNNVIIHPEAELEMRDSVRYYETRSTGLGDDLIEEIRRSLALIGESPETYPIMGKRVRRKPLRRFPYNLIYEYSPGRILVLAFAHQKRRPFYWRIRLKTNPGKGPG